MSHTEYLRELYRVTKWRDGRVWETQYVKDVWLQDPDESPPVGYVFAYKPTSYDGPTIRRVTP